MQHHALPTHRCLLLRDCQDLLLHHLDLAAHLLILYLQLIDRVIIFLG